MKKLLFLLMTALMANTTAHALEVRLAEIKVKPDQIDAFLAAVRENMRDSAAKEEGVISIYAVADKKDPTKLTFFEIYADEEAYLKHTQTAHFKKYIERTKDLTEVKILTPVSPVELQPYPQKHK